jgi:hypothetical protein
VTPGDIDLGRTNQRRADVLPIVIAVVVFSAFSIACAVSSDGFLEADSCTHYLYARFALSYPHFLVNVWGRPFCTGLFSFPALFGGLLGVRLTSLALALICAFVAYAIARGQNMSRPALALIFTLAQPLVFLHSFSELTELPFAALVGLAFLAYQRRQFLLMTMLIAISPLSRPEGFGFILLAAVALLVHRRWWWIAIPPIPLLIWDYTGWVLYGRQTYPGAEHFPHALRWIVWLKENWPYASESIYQRGSILHYVALMPAVASPLIFPATCIGIWRLSRGNDIARDHRARCRWLIAMLPLLVLVGHSLLYWRGKMASSGEMRYMLIVAPFWGLLAADGWSWAFARFRWPAVYRMAGVAALIPGFVNFDYYQVVPITPSDDLQRSRVVAEWFQSSPLREQYPRLIASEVGIYYYLDVSPTDRLRTREWTRDTVANAQAGATLVWDPVFGFYNSDANRSVRAADINAAGWVLDIPASLLVNDLSEPAELDDTTWLIWRSPHDQAGRATAVTTSLPWIANRAWDDVSGR